VDAANRTTESRTFLRRPTGERSQGFPNLKTKILTKIQALLGVLAGAVWQDMPRRMR
jgi:hypothetical protein